MGFHQRDKQEIVSFSDYRNEKIDETTFCDIGFPDLAPRIVFAYSYPSMLLLPQELLNVESVKGSL